MKKVFVLIPVLNEAPNIPRLANSLSKWESEIPGYEFHFVFINDGSTDETPSLLKDLSKSLKVETLHHKTRMGPGRAFATGFAYLENKILETDLVVTMEGDNTSKPGIVKLMAGRVEREGVDVVLASPYAYGGGMTNTSLVRVLLSHTANGLMKIALNLSGIHTFSSFYRMYTGKTVLTLQKHFGAGIIDSAGFECMVELLYKIVLCKMSVSEIPMQLDTALRAGKSKMKVMKTIRGYFRVMRIKGKWDKMLKS